MRAIAERLPSAHPIGRLLPGIYQDDDFLQRFTQGLDSVLAVVVSTLDNLEAYFDPELAPTDFVDWLAGWLGLVRDPARSLGDTRSILMRVSEIYRWRGTSHGLVDHIEVAFGVRPQIAETGGTSYASQAGAALPGSSTPRMVVTVRVEDPSSFSREALDQFVAANKPAHIPHRVEVLPIGGRSVEPEGPPPPASPQQHAGQVPPASGSPYRGYGPVGRDDW